MDGASGLYQLHVDGRPWLTSVPPVLAPGVPLHLAQSASISGKDELGVFHGVSIYWERATMLTDRRPELYTLQTLFKAYSGPGELLTFTQVYPNGIADTSAFFNASQRARMETCPKFSDRIPLPLPPEPGPGGSGQGLGESQKPSPLPASSATALGRFPAFSLRTETPLNWFAPQGNQLSATAFGRVAPLRLNALDGQATMPLVLYDASGRSVAMAPLTHFFNAVHETVSSAEVLAAGIAGSVPSLPRGFAYTTALVGGAGVNATTTSLGELLLRRGNKSRPDPAAGDSFSLGHLGFWTDNGSPYYHRNASYALTAGLGGCNEALNCTLQDALLAVKADAAARAIPLRYMQWDDRKGGTRVVCASAFCSGT